MSEAGARLLAAAKEMRSMVEPEVSIWRQIPPERLACGVNALEAATGELLDSLTDLERRVIVARVFLAMTADCYILSGEYKMWQTWDEVHALPVGNNSNSLAD